MQCWLRKVKITEQKAQLEKTLEILWNIVRREKKGTKINESCLEIKAKI